MRNKIETTKKWIKDHQTEIVSSAASGVVIAAYGLLCMKYGIRKQYKLTVSQLENSEWNLNNVPEIRKLFKDDKTELWIRIFKNKFEYSIEHLDA